MLIRRSLSTSTARREEEGSTYRVLLVAVVSGVSREEELAVFSSLDLLLLCILIFLEEFKMVVGCVGDLLQSLEEYVV